MRLGHGRAGVFFSPLYLPRLVSLHVWEHGGFDFTKVKATVTMLGGSSETLDE